LTADPQFCVVGNGVFYDNGTVVREGNNILFSRIPAVDGERDEAEFPLH